MYSVSTPPSTHLSKLCFVMILAFSFLHVVNTCKKGAKQPMCTGFLFMVGVGIVQAISCSKGEENAEAIV